MEDEFIKEYGKLKDKYNLPNFQKLAEDFDVEKAGDKESSFLLREIRRTMVEKISTYVTLFETLINPTASSIFIFSILRGLEEGDKKKIQEIYKKLSKIQLEVMKLEVVYSEKNEAESIKRIFNEWQTMKYEILELEKRFEDNFDNKENSRLNGYCD